MRPKLHENVLDNLKKLSFTSSSPEEIKRNGGLRTETDFHFSHAGRLVAGKQLVYLIDMDVGKDPVSSSSAQKIKTKNNMVPPGFEPETFCV